MLNRMHLMYTLDSEGKRLYTLKKVVSGEVTKSAHPARFSPDDRYSRYVISNFYSLCVRGRNKGYEKGLEANRCTF